MPVVIRSVPSMTARLSRCRRTPGRQGRSRMTPRAAQIWRPRPRLRLVAALTASAMTRAEDDAGEDHEEEAEPEVREQERPDQADADACHQRRGHGPREEHRRDVEGRQLADVGALAAAGADRRLDQASRADRRAAAAAAQVRLDLRVRAQRSASSGDSSSSVLRSAPTAALSPGSRARRGRAGGCHRAPARRGCSGRGSRCRRGAGCRSACAIAARLADSLLVVVLVVDLHAREPGLHRAPAG